jgi:hypothetical protein
MIQGCNAIGIALHGSVGMSLMQQSGGPSVVNIITWLKGVALTGAW